jgi:hypothetical protein
MTEQERLRLIADGVYLELKQIFQENPSISKEAAFSLLSVRIDDMVESLKIQVADRQKGSVEGTPTLFGKIKIALKYASFAITFIKKDISQTLERSFDLAADPSYVPEREISMEGAVWEVIKDEYQVRGL